MLDDPHLLIPVLQAGMPDQYSLQRMDPVERHLVAHVDGQISLAALSVFLSLPMDQMVEHIKHLLFLQVIRLCRIPPNASMALPALMGMSQNQAGEATKAWTHDQAQHKKSWSQTERALVAVAIQQTTRQEIPAIQLNQRQPVEKFLTPLQQHAPGASIDRAGIYPIIENWAEDNHNRPGVEETKDFPTPLLYVPSHTPVPTPPSGSSSTNTPWRRSAIQESLEDLEEWEQESNPSHDAFPVALGREMPGPPAPSAEELEVYQAISYYDLPTFSNEPLQKPGSSRSSSSEYLLASSAPEESQNFQPSVSTHTPKSMPELSGYIAPTLLGAPPVPQLRTLEEHPVARPLSSLTLSQKTEISSPPSSPDMPRPSIQDSGDHLLSIEPMKPRITVKRGRTSPTDEEQPIALSSVLGTLPSIPRLATVLDVPKIPNKKNKP